MNLPNNLIKLRKERGLTQSAMAEILKIPRTAYTQVENNKRVLMSNELKRLCIGLRVSADTLLSEDNTNE